MRISDWSSDVCSSDLDAPALVIPTAVGANLHRAVAGAFGMPLLDRRQLARDEQFRRLGQRKLREVLGKRGRGGDHVSDIGGRARRSEEHTSELQSLMRISYAVFCLKKTKNIPTTEVF